MKLPRGFRGGESACALCRVQRITHKDPITATFVTSLRNSAVAGELAPEGTGADKLLRQAAKKLIDQPAKNTEYGIVAGLVSTPPYQNCSSIAATPNAAGTTSEDV